MAIKEFTSEYMIWIQRPSISTFFYNIVMLLSTVSLLNPTYGWLLDSSPSIHNFHFMVYQVMCRFSLKNQDQDIGHPDSVFADLFWMFVIDSSAKYTKE